MWTPEHRAAARRQDLRYASDLTDEEWALVAPMIPPARRGGRPRDVNMREVINGLLYLLWTGCQWQALPKDLPPKSTVHHYFKLWDWDGTLERIHYALYVAVREQAGRWEPQRRAASGTPSRRRIQNRAHRNGRRQSCLATLFGGSTRKRANHDGAARYSGGSPGSSCY
jgi:transposase